MDDEKQEYEIEVNHNVEIDISWLTLGIICLVMWAPCWWYDQEIRCALGSEKACVSLKHQPAK